MNHKVGVGYVDNHLVAVLVEHALDRQTIEVLRLVVCNLLSVHGERLREVTKAIEETNGYHVYIAVGSFLEVVTSEDTQTARVDFEYMRETKLHAEVSNGSTLGIGLHVHIFAELAVDLVHAGDDILILRELDETVVIHAAEQLDGVAVDLAPKLLVEAREEFKCLGIPRPPKVVGDLVQLLKRFRNVALYIDHFPTRLVCVTNLDFHLIMKISEYYIQI